jgi:hypothetical protein
MLSLTAADVTTVDLINLVIAVIGAVTGSIAIGHQLAQSRVRIRVVPRIVTDRVAGGFFTSADEEAKPGDQFLLEVVNLSGFPVTIEQAGLVIHRRRRYVFVGCQIMPGGRSFPCRLEPREGIGCYYPGTNGVPTESMAAAQKAFVKTSCGQVRYGDSAALRSSRSLAQRQLATRKEG